MPKSSNLVIISFPTVTSHAFRLSPVRGCYRTKLGDGILKNNFIFSEFS